MNRDSQSVSEQVLCGKYKISYRWGTSDLMVFTVYDKRYQRYAELWTACLNRSYPEYTIATVEVSHRCLNEIIPAMLRYTLDPTEGVEEYVRHVYVTDVDMMLLREPTPIREFHLAEMEREGLCYSNTPRATEHMGPHRLTGLHFASLEWYGKTKAQRERWQKLIDMGWSPDSEVADELTLMAIAKASGLPIPEKKPLIPRHHGIHLGTLRDFWTQKKRLKEELRIRVTPDMARQWIDCTADYPPRPGDAGLCEHLDFLYAFCQRRAKQ